jgi:hypothetical protein
VLFHGTKACNANGMITWSPSWAADGGQAYDVGIEPLEPSAQYDFNKACEFLTLLSSIDAQRAEVLAQHQALSLAKMGANVSGL